MYSLVRVLPLRVFATIAYAGRIAVGSLQNLSGPISPLGAHFRNGGRENLTDYLPAQR